MKKIINLLFILIVWVSLTTSEGSKVFVDPTTVYLIKSKVIDISENNGSPKSWKNGSLIILNNNERIEVRETPKQLINIFKEALRKPQ